MLSGWNVTRRRAVPVVSLLMILAPSCGDNDKGPTGPELPEAGEVRTFSLPNGVPMEFVWIEPGTFMMGSTDTEPGRYDNEGPQHEVTISRGFWLGKYVITQEQWQAVMGTTPWSGIIYVRDHPRHPAVFISWDDVQQLIAQLNAHAGAEVYRLPTEAEWEYACRAGTTTRWSFGDDEAQLGDYAWYYANAWDAGLRYAQPVGTKLPNPWGLYDMHGNVQEWVQDWFSGSLLWYGSYSDEAQVDPQGPSRGSIRVFRGGFFGSYPNNTRSAARRADTPAYGFNFNGARLLRTP